MIQILVSVLSLSAGALADGIQPLPAFNSKHVMVRRADAGVESDSMRSCSFGTKTGELIQFNCTKGIGIGSGLEVRILDGLGVPKTPNGSWVQGSVVRYLKSRAYWLGSQCPLVDFCNQIGAVLASGVAIQTEYSSYRTFLGNTITQVNLDLEL